MSEPHQTPPPYPAYSRGERIADAVVHIVGIGLALAGVTALFVFFADKMGWGTLTATGIYAAGLMLMLIASAAYHTLAHTPARPILRRIDHAAIYLKIAGTFTPLSVILGTGFGYVVLALVWSCALIGAFSKMMTGRGQMTTGWLPYFLLGFAGVLLMVPLAGILSLFSIVLMVMGGLLYTLGIVFYCWESLRYANAIWHVFVLMASAAFFVGIGTALAQALPV